MKLVVKSFVTKNWTLLVGRMGFLFFVASLLLFLELEGVLLNQAEACI